MIKSIFDNIEEKDVNKIIKNLDAKVITYEKNRIIPTVINGEKLIGIIIDGVANIEKYDYNGNKTIIDKLEINSVFSDLFLYIKNDISIVTATKCKVLLFEYNNLLKNLKNMTFINNIFNMLTLKITQLHIRIEILSKRTIKDKLLTYFKILSKKNNNKTFNLPFTYTELADYISVDRSAMMRELKKLKENGNIKTNNRTIKLIKE